MSPFTVSNSIPYALSTCATPGASKHVKQGMVHERQALNKTMIIIKYAIKDGISKRIAERTQA